MVSAWRLVHKRRAASAFTGDGARRYGGRWNNKGKKAIYAADSLALATLEIMVHAIVYEDLLSYLYFEVQFSNNLIETIKPAKLPKNWRKDPAPAVCKNFGDRWLKSRSKPILKIPSVVLPESYNFIIDPVHPDYGRIKVSKPKPFHLDHRIIPKQELS